MKITIKDSKTLKDSIVKLQQKFKDAEIDLTKAGVQSIANALLEKKDKIGNTKGFAELRDIVKEVFEKYDSPKSKEYLVQVDQYNRLYQRDPRPGSRNDYWLWERLLKYVWNIILKASGNPSPDAKQVKEEKVGDDETDIQKLCRLLGEAHDKIMEAQEIASDLIEEGVFDSDLEYALDDLESDLSQFDYMGESNPARALMEAFPTSEYDLDDEYDEDEEE